MSRDHSDFVVAPQKSLWSVAVISVRPISADRFEIECVVSWNDISQLNIPYAATLKYDNGIAIYVYPTMYCLVITRGECIFRTLAAVVS